MVRLSSKNNKMSIVLFQIKLMSFNHRTIQPITVYSKPNAVDLRKYAQTNVAQIIPTVPTQCHSNNQYQMKPYPYPNKQQSNLKQFEKTRIKTSISDSEYFNYNRLNNTTDLSKSIINGLDKCQPQQKIMYSTSQQPFSNSMQNSFSRISNISAIEPRVHNYNEDRSYKELAQQNAKLKRIIKQQCEPLKQAFSKLKQQHDERDYLVSKLEWKVRQLANELSNKNR